MSGRQMSPAIVCKLGTACCDRTSAEPLLWHLFWLVIFFLSFDSLLPLSVRVLPADCCVGSEKLKTLHTKFTTLMHTRDIPLSSFAEGETTNLPLRFRATLVPQESSGEKIV